MAPDPIEGNEEEYVLVVEGMVEVMNDDETLFPAAEGGIIENSELVAGDNDRDGAAQVLELVDAETEGTGSVLIPAPSDGICAIGDMFC